MSPSAACRLLAFFGLFMSIASAAAPPPKAPNAKCPAFTKGSCSEDACGLPSSSYPSKFRVNISDAPWERLVKHVVFGTCSSYLKMKSKVSTHSFFLIRLIPRHTSMFHCRLSCALRRAGCRGSIHLYLYLIPHFDLNVLFCAECGPEEEWAWKAYRRDLIR